MTINVYQSIMPGEPAEIYNYSGLTVEQFMQSVTPKYRRSECQPVTCAINGAIVKPLDWHDAWIGENDIVDIRPVPRGGVLDVVFPFWAGTVNVAATQAFNYLLPDIPGQPGSGQQGSQLEPARGKANTARLGQAVPEVLGEYIRYPDYITQPRRYYKDTKTQALDLTLSIGAGEYEIDTSQIRIGDTPVDDLGNAVTYAIHGPGETLPAAYKNWYNSPEVGASTNSAGIRLEGLKSKTLVYTDLTTDSGTDTISSIVVDDLWEVGFIVSIKLFQPITVTDDVTADILDGNFQHLSVGDVVLIEEEDGSFGSTYPSPDGLFARVRTLNGSKTQMTLEDTSGSPSPITDIDPGNYNADVNRITVTYTIASKTSTSLTFDAEDNLGNPVSPSLPTLTGVKAILNFDLNDFTQVWAGPYLATPDGETATTFEIDIFLPIGLGEIDEDEINPRSRDIEIQHREPGTVTWSSDIRTIQGASRDQLGYTFSITRAGATGIEVRVRRNNAENVATTSLDKIEWIGLRSELARADSYDDVTTLTMTIDGSDAVATSSENRINLLPKRKLPEISGGALTAPVATSKISAAAVYVAKSLGYDDDQIDLDQFETLESTWTSRGDRFDYVFSDTTAMRAIETILRAGFSEMTLDTGIITPVRDEPRTILEDGYSPENMIGPLRREFQTRQVDEPDGVEVEFVDGNTWTVETVNAFLPGDLGVKVDKIKIDGVTDRTRAWRIGMRRRRAQKYRRWTYTFSTELDALNSSYLSYVPLLDDIPGYGKVSILTSISSDRITVSEPLEFVSGQTHVVAYRDEDGSVVGPFTATQGPDEYTALVTIPEPFPPVRPSNQEPTHVYFGTSDRWHFPSLITEIRPSGPLTVDVTATNYDDRLYDDDDNAPT